MNRESFIKKTEKGILYYWDGTGWSTAMYNARVYSSLEKAKTVSKRLPQSWAEEV